MDDIKMLHGDRICLYTGGVTECAGPDGEPFGDERLTAALNRNSGLSAAELKHALLADLQHHRGSCPTDDDVMLLIAEVS